MDRPARVRAELERQKVIARQAIEAGPPCRDCRYATILGTCGNPAYYEQSFAPASGRYAIDQNTSFDDARSVDGLCGPEALLWEPQSKPVAIISGVGRQMETHPWVTVFSFVGLWGLLEALF
jgi:hypothetical protein